LAPTFGFRFAGLAIAILGLAVFGVRIWAGDAPTATAWRNRSAPRELKLSLPANLAGWQRLDVKDDRAAVAETAGVRSVLWHFQRGGAQATVAVDYPLEGFHNVKVCYTHRGWRVVKEENLTNAPHMGEMHAIKAVMDKSVCLHAVVFHAVINEQGQWLSAPERIGALHGRLFRSRAAEFQTSYRIQVLTGGYVPLSDSVVSDAQELFFAASQTLAQQLLSQFPKSGIR
jgi:hypothetical protein